MKRIEIIISTSGESHVETKGFAGSQCQDASRFLESAAWQANIGVADGRVPRRSRPTQEPPRTGDMTLTKVPNATTLAERAATADLVRILLLLEGTNDIELLRRISVLLHAYDGSLPDLADVEQRNELVFIPFEFGCVRAWTHRPSSLGQAGVSSSRSRAPA